MVRDETQLSSASLRAKKLQHGDDPRYELVGYHVEEPPTKGVWTRVGRLFTGPNGERAYLAEYDFASAGAAIKAISENVNATVKGSPGTLIALKSMGTRSCGIVCE